MKNKNFLRILAIVCVLVLCVGVLAACNKDGNNNGGNNNGGNNNGGNNGGNPAGDAMNAFVNTMFSSANEIANGISFELADGKNIALSLGAAITLKKDGGALEKLPIELALKGFIDRENIIDKFIVDNENGAYVLSGNDVTIFTDTTELKEDEIRVTKEENGYVVDNENGSLVAKFVAFDSTSSAQAGYTRFSKAVVLTSDNETYLDASARINGIDSFRLVYEKDFLYVTIAGNKVGVDLSSLEKTANGQTVKDSLFTMVEGLLRNDIVKSIVGAFNGENFNLNEVITGLINTFVEKKYVPYSADLYNAANRNRYNYNEVKGEYVQADNGEFVVKTLADTIYENGNKEIMSGMTIANVVEMIFQNKNNVYACLGETIDLQRLLTLDLGGSPLASMLFSEPVWKTWKNGKFVTANKGYASVKSDMSQKLSATIALNPLGFGEMIALVKNGAIKIGFEKEAGADGSVGKMSKFFIDLNLPAGENNRTFGVELAITDLKIGNSKDTISTTAVNKEEYGAMNFDAGLDFDFGEDLLSLIAHDFTDPDGLTIEVGGDDLKFDKDANTLVVPETLKFNVKGSLDFVNLENTRVVATLKANDKTVAKLQFYAVNTSKTDTPVYDLQLDAKVMDEYKDVIPAILDMCVVLGKNGGIGVNGFKKVNDKWGFYDAEGNVKVGDVLYSVYEEDANGNYGLNAETNEYFLLTDENSASYTGTKYKKYDVSYSYAKVNESLNHLIMNGEAHVTGLNFVKLVNYFINKGDNGLFVNYDENKAEAAAAEDITISDVIMNLLLKSDKGILPAVYGIIGIDKVSGLDNSLVIGGDNLLATTFNNLFEYKTDRKIDAVSMVALAMKYFTKYQVVATGKTYDSVEVYKEFETELYKMNARGIFAQGLSKQLMLARPVGYVTDGEKYFAENKDKATTDNMKQYGYAVVEDAAGNKYLYPYALYEELVAKKTDATYLSAEGFTLTDDKLVLVNTPDKLFEDIVSKLNAEKATADNYLDVAGAELRQAYRLGKTFVPYFADNTWKVSDKSAAGTSVNAEIINDVGLKIIVGTQKSGDRATRGTAMVEGKVYGKTFTITGYVNFLTSDPTTDSDIEENLVSEETKNKSFDIEILNPKTYNK